MSDLPQSKWSGAKYRYWLQRHWKGMLMSDNVNILFVMLNPSTADETKDDPTIRRCVWFTKKFGGNLMRVVNLCPVRATKPKDIEGVLIPSQATSVNLGGIATSVDGAHIVIAAWGAQDLSRIQGAMRARSVVLSRSKKIYCLGKTQDGSPRHPLYVPKTATLEEYP